MADNQLNLVDEVMGDVLEHMKEINQQNEEAEKMGKLKDSTDEKHTNFDSGEHEIKKYKANLAAKQHDSQSAVS